MLARERTLRRQGWRPDVTDGRRSSVFLVRGTEKIVVGDIHHEVTTESPTRTVPMLALVVALSRDLPSANICDEHLRKTETRYDWKVT